MIKLKGVALLSNSAQFENDLYFQEDLGSGSFRIRQLPKVIQK